VILKSGHTEGLLSAEGIIDELCFVVQDARHFENCIFQVHLAAQYSASKELQVSPLQIASRPPCSSSIRRCDRVLPRCLLPRTVGGAHVWRLDFGVSSVAAAQEFLELKHNEKDDLAEEEDARVRELERLQDESYLKVGRPCHPCHCRGVYLPSHRHLHHHLLPWAVLAYAEALVPSPPRAGPRAGEGERA
jgi:hypothetical protein